MINVYTEEEAKDKVCPQAIHFLGMKPLINCMGGACMAWKQCVEYSTVNDTQHDMSVKVRLVTTVTGGYCGLAGKP